MAASKKFNVEDMLKPVSTPEIKEDIPKEDKTVSEGKNEAKSGTSKPENKPAPSKLKKNATKKEAEIDESEYIRQTYYINKKHIGAIELIAFKEHKDKSEVIRDIIDDMIENYCKKNPGFEAEVIERGIAWVPKERSKKSK